MTTKHYDQNGKQIGCSTTTTLLEELVGFICGGVVAIVAIPTILGLIIWVNALMMAQ